MKPLLLLLFACALIGAPRQGILRCPVSSGAQRYGQAGDVVTFRPSGRADRPGFFDVQVAGRWLDAVGGYCILPLDPEIVPPRVFLLLHQPPPVIEADRQNLIALSKAVLKLFPGHRLSEGILARLPELIAGEPDGKSVPQEAVALAREYLRKYPSGPDRDRLEWLICRWLNSWYEYEGVAVGPASEAKAYEAFLRDHPGSSVIDDVKLRLAMVSRIAAECVFHGEHEGFSSADGQRFEARARELYQSLARSPDPVTRETARLALTNMSRGRTAYTCCGFDR